MLFQQFEERISLLLDVSVAFFFNAFQLLFEGIEEAFLMKTFIDSGNVRLVFVFENVSSKVLDFVNHVPRLVVLHGIGYVFHNPVEHGRLAVEFLYHFVDGLLFNLNVVQGHRQVRVQFQFACQIAQDGLEKLVDGLHSEVVEVVE